MAAVYSAMPVFYYRLAGSSDFPATLTTDTMAQLAAAYRDALGLGASYPVSDVRVFDATPARRRRLAAVTPDFAVFGVQLLRAPPGNRTVAAMVEDIAFSTNFAQQLVAQGFTAGLSIQRSDAAGNGFEIPAPLTGG